MLVLSRRLHERIQFPGLNITVQVVAIKPGVVRIGIEAPPDVKVFRDASIAQNRDVERSGAQLFHQKAGVKFGQAQLNFRVKAAIATERFGQ